MPPSRRARRAEPPQPAPSPARAEPDAAPECVVCWSAPRAVVLTACGHAVLCEPCLTRVREGLRPRCPVCETVIPPGAASCVPLDGAVAASGLSAAPAFLPASVSAAVAAEAAQLAQAGPDAARAQQLFLAALTRGEEPDEDLQDLAVGSDATAAQRAACINAALDVVAAETRSLPHRRAAMSCLANICGENYDAIPPHAERLLEVCARVLEREADAGQPGLDGEFRNRALQAWSNLAAVGATVDEDDPCVGVAGAAARGPRLLPLVLHSLRPTHSEEDWTDYSEALHDSDDLMPQSAAQLCLVLLAHPRVAADAVVAAVSALADAALANVGAAGARGGAPVQRRRQPRDWRSLEAVALALSCCTKAPPRLARPLLRAHLPRLVALLTAPEARLCRAAAYAIAEVLQCAATDDESATDGDTQESAPPPLLDASLVAALVRPLMAALRNYDIDVAGSAATSLSALAECCKYDDNSDGGGPRAHMAPYALTVARALLTGNRPGAIGAVAGAFSTTDRALLARELLPGLIRELQASVAYLVDCAGEDDAETADVVAQHALGACTALCGVTLRLQLRERDGPSALHHATLLEHAGDMASACARLCTLAGELPPHEALSALGALARAAGVHIAPHLAAMMPALLRGLEASSLWTDDGGACAAAAEAVCDVCRACTAADGGADTMEPHADALMVAILSALAAARSTAHDKAALVCALACMATVLNGGFMYCLHGGAALGNGFELYVSETLDAFHRMGLAATLAATAAAEAGDEEEEDAANQLRVQLLTAYPDVLVAARPRRVPPGVRAPALRASAAALERVVEFVLACAADPALEEATERKRLRVALAFVLGAMCKLPGGSIAVANASGDVDEILRAVLADENPSVAEVHLVARGVQLCVRALRPE